VDIGAVELSTSSISGHFYNDLNANGRADSGEAGLAYWQAYVDKNNNGICDTPASRPPSLTNRGITPSTASPVARTSCAKVRQDGWRRTQPAGIYPLGYYTPLP